MIRIVSLVLSLAAFGLLFSSCDTSSGIGWIDITELDAHYQSHAKKAIVFIYDPGCATCDSVRTEAFGNSQLNDYLKSKFHIADLSISESRDITLNDRRWQMVTDLRNNQYHELAASLSYSKDAIHTPTIAFIDESQNLIVPIKKKINDKELELLASYIAADEYAGGKSIAAFEEGYQYRYQ